MPAEISYNFFSAVIQHIRFGSAVYKITLPVGNYFSVEVLLGTRFMNFHGNYICCIDLRVEFTKCKIPLIESASTEPTVKGLESFEDNYSGPTVDTPTTKMD